MLKNIIRIWPILFILLINLLFFSPVFKGKLPFPGDTLIGAYSPWRDLKWGQRTTEYPLKNMNVSDVTSSLYPWRYLAVEQMKAGKWPLWNDYEFSGTPLLANPYTAAFYPLNVLFFIFSFSQAWTILIILQPILAGLFFYFFLSNKGLSKVSSFLGSITYSFGSYFFLLTEFSMIGHTSLWFPLSLLAIDRLVKKKNLIWFLVLVFSLTMPLFAGFVQFMLFGYLLVFLYTFFQNRHVFPRMILAMIIAGFLASVQLVPFIEFLTYSGRINAYGDTKLFTDFFIPLRQLFMFFVPDYFGNPATANYWGKGNYYEFCGYFGIISLVFVLFLVIAKQVKGEIRFWLLLSLVFLFFTVKNPISSLPYSLNVPGLSALIPSRLLFFPTFGFSVLAAMGAEYFYTAKNTFKPFVSSWVICSFLITAGILLRTTGEGTIIFRNSILPMIYLFVSLCIFLLSLKIFKGFSAKAFVFLVSLILLFDLFRQGQKFLTFFDSSLLYPQTGTTKFLQENIGFSRFMPLHQEIFGTNHQTMYRLESIEGFCAYYINNYGRFVSLGQSYSPIDPFTVNFERTVFGRNYQANVFKLLSVKYFLTFEDIKSPDYPLVFQEGKTKIYENTKALPRAFLACNVENNSDSLEMMQKISLLKDPAGRIYSQDVKNLSCLKNETTGEAKITNYSSGFMEVTADSPGERMLVTGDVYYPGWKVYVDWKKNTVMKVDYALRGVIVPAGKHQIRFIYEPESFTIGLILSSITIVFLTGTTGYLIFKRKWL